MAIFCCEFCGHRQQVDSEHLGRTGLCPECQSVGPIINGALPQPQTNPAAPWIRFVAIIAGTALIAPVAIALCLWLTQNTSLRAASTAGERANREPARVEVAPESVSHAKQRPTDRTQTIEPSVPAVRSNENWADESHPSAGNTTTASVAKPVPSSADRVAAVTPSSVVAMPASSTPPQTPTSVPAATATSVTSTAPPIPAATSSTVSTTGGGQAVVPNGNANPTPTQSPAGPVTASAQQINLGKQLFEHEWTPIRSAGKGDGLGPVFNGRSCVECHFQAGTGGSGTNAHNVHSFEILPMRNGQEIRTGVIHTSATAPSFMETREGLSQLLGDPQIPLKGPANRIVTADAIRNVWINTPALWGNGLIDQISDQDLKELERSPGITGRFRILKNGAIGKFGWKSQIETLHEFVGGACATELGLTNSVKRQHDPTHFDVNPRAKLDMTDDQLTALVSFVGQLPAPRQVIPQDASMMADIVEGHRLFSQIGCANCHVEDVGSVRGIYSDFRLHAMEPSTIRATPERPYYTPPEYKPVYEPPSYQPKLAEWKTPPLWGVADTAPYWHDGSAPTLSDAISHHNNDGKQSSEHFKKLGKDKQDQLLAFLGSLKAPVR